MCRALQVPPFQRPRDLLFMKEYCEVMKPVACALDILQRDDVYIGHLLPTISVLKKRLQHLSISGLRYCSPLVVALLEGVAARFDHLYDDRDLLLASIVIPRFKDRWLEDESQRQEIIQLLTEEVARPCYQNNHAEDDRQLLGKDSEDDYFSFVLPVAEESGRSVVSRYLACPSNSPLTALTEHDVVRKVFLRYNTALPLSAAVERVFSIAADIMTRKRAKVTDENFERQLMLKLNACNTCE
ncbi:uncharacterized protein LOC135391490 [Ornithodoros turicata]|uniref:uncharacterized protein LOC135391490 n=1 Tax=Ornithodoros turicata TaxID=34597 RepID=UPI003139629B